MPKVMFYILQYMIMGMNMRTPVYMEYRNI